MLALTLLLAAAARQFADCSTAMRMTCVDYGDNCWLNGERIWIANINTPKHTSQCPAEHRLVLRPRDRLAELLNTGPFALERVHRHCERHGRLLRVMVRDGATLGDKLVGEGLARPWTRWRSLWCA